MGTIRTVINSPEEMKKLGEKLAEKMKEGVAYLLVGDFGTGKTTFVKGVARKFGIDENEVQSPSFTIMNVYEGKKKIYHFDLYRIQHSFEAEELGLDEIQDGIIIIEWPQLKINRFFGKMENRRIMFEHGDSENQRIVVFNGD